MLAWLIPLVIIVALVGGTILIYNRLVRLRNRTANAWSQVDVQLRKRYDLVPNLVETVKGYASHEQAVFDEVTRLRAAAQGASSVEGQARAENALTAALGRLFAVAEDYPDLRASQNFQQLQGQLDEIESNVAVSRQVYNDTVLTYQNAIETVPNNIVAGLFGFKRRSYFEIEDVAREPVNVEF